MSEPIVRSHKGAAYHAMQDLRHAAKIRLAMPDTVERAASFGEVLNRRRSRTGTDVDAVQLSTWLFYAARVIDTFVTSWGIEQHRPYPSAGALHPINLIRCVERGPELYDPFSHAMIPLTCREEPRYRAFLLHTREVAGPSGDLFVVAAMISITSRKYTHAVTLALRDGGAMLGIGQLVAAWLGLECRPLAPLGKALTANLADPIGLLPVGCILLTSTKAES
jgi:hypothetical protein